MQGPECLLGTRGVDGTPKAAPFLSLLSTCWQLSSLYVGLVLLWPHRLGWPHSLCSGLSLSCPRGPQTSGPITGPPKECLWAAAPVAVEVGSRSAPFVQTLVFLSEADRAEVSRFAKNFLPILFNLYGQPAAAGDTPAPRRAVLETIKTYLTITEPQVSWWTRRKNSLQ